jgi:hypothetical protein
MPLKLYIPFAALFICLLCAVTSQAASADVIEGAKKEGEINWYGGGSSEIDEDINRGFMKKYPFIQAKKFRIQSQRLLVRFETESRAGKHMADILRTTDWYIDIFKKKNLLLKYDSPERKQIPDELKDRDGFLYRALYVSPCHGLQHENGAQERAAAFLRRPAQSKVERQARTRRRRLCLVRESA